MSTIISTRTSPADVAEANADPDSYWDESHGVRVYLIDFSTDKAYGVTVQVDTTVESNGLFVCVSKGLPIERRHDVVHGMLTAWARQYDAARAEDRIAVSAVSA